MRILLTGASGYIGKRLLPVLVDSGHEVICCVRDIERFAPPASLKSRIEVIRIDLLDKASLENIPQDIDGAYYLVHSMSTCNFDFNISEFIHVPSHGCFTDIKERTFTSRDSCINNIWRIGGENGWYYGNWLWRIRGFLDKIGGGVGLRRGRTSENSLSVGDALDFWRVLYADKSEGRLLLFAEMKLPGEAWLEFRIIEDKLIQTATFRPLGLIGRLYWYAVLPFHGFIFKGMIQEITKRNNV